MGESYLHCEECPECLKKPTVKGRRVVHNNCDVFHFDGSLARWNMLISAYKMRQSSGVSK